MNMSKKNGSFVEISFCFHKAYIVCSEHFFLYIILRYVFLFDTL